MRHFHRSASAALPATLWLGHVRKHTPIATGLGCLASALRCKVAFRTLLISLALMTGVAATAQRVTLSGTVTDGANGQPIAGVLVTVRPSGAQKVLAFTQTMANGRFEVTLTADATDRVLYFSMMGYAARTLPIKKGRTTYDVTLKEQATALREVVIRAPSIHERGDTITYIVSRFATTADRSLGDVLKKMPGIEVEKSGAITYNGKAINKFYIEGKDMLEGRYGIATNNIHPSDVGSVEVMENHQPVKALENISFSQNPAINIRLKEDAKARWVGTAKAAVGASPFLWEGELALMRFKRKSQTLNTLKSNNTGRDVTREAALLIDGERAESALMEHIEVSPDRLRAIDGDRSRFNRSHLVTTNNLWGVSKDFDLTSQVTYGNHRLTSDVASSQTYFLDDSTVFTESDEHTLSRRHTCTGDITLTANTPSLYVRNKLQVDLRWDDTQQTVRGTYPNRQAARLPRRSFSDELELIRRHGRRAYSLRSLNVYRAHPHRLTVRRSDGDEQQQRVESSVFYTHTHTSLSFYFDPVALSLRAGLVGTWRSLRSALTGLSDSLGSLRNDISTRRLRLYVSPELAYRHADLEATVRLPLSLLPYRHTDHITGRTTTRGHLLFAPTAYIQWYLTSRLTLSLDGRLSPIAPDEQTFYEGLILRDYRHLSQGLIDDHLGRHTSADITVRYRYPLRALFAHASAGYMQRRRTHTVDSRFLGAYLLQTTIPEATDIRSWTADASLSKGIDALRSIVTLSASFLSTRGTAYRNRVPTFFTSTNRDASCKLSTRLATWCNTAYELSLSQSTLHVDRPDLRSSYLDLSQRLTLHLIPHRMWSLRLTAEHYSNEIADGLRKQLLLADAELTCSLKGGWEVNVSARNLFNRRTYAYTLYDGPATFRKSYLLRPRNLTVGLFFRF